jgi:hypothetical protein
MNARSRSNRHAREALQVKRMDPRDPARLRTPVTSLTPVTGPGRT